MDSNITAGSPALTEGNRKITGPSSDYGKSLGTLAFDTSTSTGYYWEVTFTNSVTEIGIMNNQKRPTASNSSDVGATILQARGGGGGNTWWFNQDDSEVGDTGVAHSSSHRIQVAVKNGNIWFGYNNTWFLSGNPSTGANPAFTGLESRGLQRPYFAVYDAISMTIHMNDDDWSYSPPTGFVALQQDNLPETGKGIPDLVWIKNRDATDSHQLYDSSRGPLNRMSTNNTDGEDVVTDGLQKFLKGGCAIEDDVALNTAGESYVSWNWVAGGGTTSANTDGVGATVACTIQKNTTAGISIVEWTGGGSAGTIEHGLGKVPAWMMYKRKNADGDAWVVYHHKLNSGSPEDGHLSLQTTGSTFSNDATIFNDTAPTTQLATIGTYGMQNTEKRVGYFFAEIPGFSKFGSYVGNGNSDGPFIYTGFKPAWLLFKALNGASWYITDNKMFTNNPNSAEFHPDTTAVQTTLASGRGVDYLSNGFKIRQEAGYGYNYDGTTTVYFCFAEHPFNGDGENAFATAK